MNLNNNKDVTKTSFHPDSSEEIEYFKKGKIYSNILSSDIRIFVRKFYGR